MTFGKAMERAIKSRAADSDLFRYVATANHWDFEFGPGEHGGVPFELTTLAGVDAHAARPYGQSVEYITYTRPDDYLFYLFSDN